MQPGDQFPGAKAERHMPSLRFSGKEIVQRVDPQIERQKPALVAAAALSTMASPH